MPFAIAAPASPRRTCRTSSIASIAAMRPGRGRRAPAWACGLPAACWPSSRAGSGRRTAPTAAREFTIVGPRGARSRRPGPPCRMTAPARILLVDDEVAIQRAVGPLLRSRGYDVEIAATGADALRMFAEQPARLDRARPGPARSGRDRGLPADPGARQDADHRAVGARGRSRQGERARPRRRRLRDEAVRSGGAARAHPRRAAARCVAASAARPALFRAGDSRIDYDRRRALRGDDEIRLTPKEFELLSLLARNHDRVLTHRAILKAIWGPNAVEQTGAPVDAGGPAAQEDRAGPRHSPVHPERAVGRLPLRHG